MIVLVAAAVCPHPPGLVPELAPGTDLNPVREAALEATRLLVAAEPERMVIVGGGDVRASYPPSPAGTLAGYGADIGVRLADAVAESSDLPLSLLIGTWLLGQAGWEKPARGEQIPQDASPAECARIGAEFAGEADRVGLLIMGDGAVGRTGGAPRPYDPRAERFDDMVVTALRNADPVGILALDPELAAELGVAGRAAWQVLAGAALGEDDVSLDSVVLYEGAPWGVGYVVAVWDRHG